MICEMCGKETDELVSIRIEGAILQVCKSCARHGVRVRERKQKSDESEIVPVENYGSIIRKEREKLGLTREELARKLNLSESYLRNLEHEKVELDMKTGRLLEKFFGIKLFERLDMENTPLEKKETGYVTLGDIAKVKWGK